MIDPDEVERRALRRAGFPTWEAIYAAAWTDAKAWLSDRADDPAAMVAAVDRAMTAIRANVAVVLVHVQDEAESTAAGFFLPRSAVRPHAKALVDRLRSELATRLDTLHHTLTEAARTEAGRFDAMAADFLSALEEPL